jgi:hypothetical protein
MKKNGPITSVLVSSGVSLLSFTYLLGELETQCDSYACLQSVTFNVASSEITCWRAHMVTGSICFDDMPSYKQITLENNSHPPPKRNILFISHSWFCHQNKRIFKFEVLAFLWSLCESVMYTKFKNIFESILA